MHDWPTYPQVYAMGELIGGLDVLNDMAGDVNLYEQLLTEEQRKAHAGEGNGDEVRTGEQRGEQIYTD